MTIAKQNPRSWLRRLLILTLLILALAVATLPTLANENDDRLFEANQIVIKLNPTANATVEQINATYGTRTLNMLLSSRGIYLLQVPPSGGDDDGVGNDDERLKTLVEQMADDNRLLYVEPNYRGAPPEQGGRHRIAWGGADSGPYAGQYAAQMLRLTEAHALSRGAGTVVAVLDTGFQLDHSALAGKLTTARYDFVDDDAVPTEEFANLDKNGDSIVDDIAGHGTHVAATVLLIAPDAQIMPIRVLNEKGYGNIFLIAEAVDFAVANGADVINLSLGTAAESEILGDVIEDAVEAGLVVVAAAGNLASSAPIFPAADEDVLAVGAVDQNKQRTDFSNHGEWLAIAAPGDAIYSAFPMNGYASWSGTSMATPFVAGQAALLKAARSELSGAEIVTRILTTAEALNVELGAGLINPLASLQANGSNPDPQPCDCDDDNGPGDGECADDDCIDNGGPGADDDEDRGHDGDQGDGLCDDDDGDGEDDVCEELEVDVDADVGGTLMADGGDVEIRFPAGSITTSTRFRWTETELDDEARSIAPGVFGQLTFVLKALDGDEIDDDFEFDEPIQMIIRYDDRDVSGMDENQVMLYYRDSVQNAWLPVTETCTDDEDDRVIRDVNANELTVAVCHLTQFGLFGDLNATGAVFLPLVMR